MVARTPENIEVLKKENLYGKFFRVDEYTLKYPRYDGTMSKTVGREVMERGDAAGILLYDPDRRELVFVEQLRIGVFVRGEYPWILECAAGIIGPDETPERVAVREAEEETGIVVTAVEPVASYFTSPGGISEKLFVFCGRIDSSRVSGYGGLEDENEDIRVVVLSENRVEEMLAAGGFDNALTLVAVQWFVLNKEKLRKKWGMS